MPVKDLKSSKADVREYCFNVWRQNNYDFNNASKQIKKENYCSATRNTLARWSKKYNWQERATALEVKEEKAKSVESEVLHDLVEVHRKIMKYINSQSIDDVDTAKVNSLIRNAKEVADITGKIRKNRQEEQEQANKEESIQFNIKGI